MPKQTKTQANLKTTVKKTVRPKTSVSVPPMDVGALLAVARDAAWNGAHARTIEMCTQVLAVPTLKTADAMEALDVRAESLIALGQLPEARQDADAMLKRARSEKGVVAKGNAYKAQALNRKAIVQMRQGELPGAVKTATAALRAARASNDKRRVARCLNTLSEALFRTGEFGKGEVSARQASELFRKLGDESGQSRSYWMLAGTLYGQGKIEEHRRACEQALALALSNGDRYATGSALNMHLYSDAD